MKAGGATGLAPYLVLGAFVILMSVPVGWAAAALGAVAAARLALRLAREGHRRQIERTARAAEGPGMVLGRDARNREVSVSDRQLLAHGLIVGASGAGKSTTVLAILVDRIERGLPVVAIDLKGSPSFADRLSLAARHRGREFLMWTPDGPAHWNPLAAGNATELKDKLIATERFTEPHYQRAAERYLQTALQVLLATGVQPQLAEVVAMMDPRRLAAAARGLASPLAERVQDYLAGLSSDQLSAVHGLGTRLAILSESHAGPFLAAPPSARSGSVVDLRSALDGSAVVLFSLNSSMYGKLAAQLGTLAIQDLLSATGHRLASHGPHRPALVAIDEFSALGADHVLHLLARGREAGVGTLLATQELADLDRAAPGFRDQVLGLTAVKLVHRQDVPTSARLVAELAGTELVWERTHQIRGPFATGGSLGTERQVERYVIHPNEIKTLQTGQALLLTKTPAARVTRMRVSPAAPASTPAAAVPAARAAPPCTPSPTLRHGRAAPPEPTRSASRSSGLGRGDQADPGVTR